MAKQDVKIQRSYAEGPRRLATGEDAIALYVNIPYLLRYIEEGAPVKFMILKEGVMTSVSIMAITRSAPHPNAARAFINTMLTKEGQQTVTLMGMGPLRKDVKLNVHPEVLRILEASPRPLRDKAAVERENKLLNAKVPSTIFGLGK